MNTRSIRISARLSVEDIDNLAVVRACLDAQAGGDCGYSLTDLLCFCIGLAARMMGGAEAHTQEEQEQ